MRALLLAAALLCAGFGCASAAPAVISINSWDPGGDIETYLMWFKRVAKSGATLRINGACISACTYGLGIVPASRTCITNRASFGFHQTTRETRRHTFVVDRKFTKAINEKLYPKWVKDFLAKKPPLTLDLTFMTAKDMRGHLKPCR